MRRRPMTRQHGAPGVPGRQAQPPQRRARGAGVSRRQSSRATRSRTSFVGVGQGLPQELLGPGPADLDAGGQDPSSSGWIGGPAELEQEGPADGGGAGRRRAGGARPSSDPVQDVAHLLFLGLQVAQVVRRCGATSSGTRSTISRP
ncbi:MAG: hypothetical protein MZV64_49600 [Ignavibacteriales bacterium]|nr:hypothetical protein [Ignavibacteriales bacterium]